MTRQKSAWENESKGLCFLLTVILSQGQGHWKWYDMVKVIVPTRMKNNKEQAWRNQKNTLHGMSNITGFGDRRLPCLTNLTDCTGWYVPHTDQSNRWCKVQKIQILLTSFCSWFSTIVSVTYDWKAKLHRIVSLYIKSWDKMITVTLPIDKYDNSIYTICTALATARVKC